MQEAKMIAELTVSSLTKVLSPIVSMMVKDLVGALKEGAVKVDAGRSSAIIAGLVININTVKTIWSKDKGVLLEEFYQQPTVLSKSSGAAINAAKLLEQDSVIAGIVGQGKSMLMRKLLAHSKVGIIGY
jgi:hypothetical protein